jgi:hypothetical protein
VAKSVPIEKIRKAGEMLKIKVCLESPLLDFPTVEKAVFSIV